MNEIIHPVYKDNNIAVVFTPDESFIASTAVAIESIIETSNIDYNYDICVIYTSVSELSREKVKSLSKKHNNISIRFYNISDHIKDYTFFTGSVYTGTKYSKEAYYRLLIPTLMPEYKKVIYLDGDLITLVDISELFEYDLTGYMIASVRDYGGICNCYIPGDPRREYRGVTLGLKNIDDYFISGVLIFNNEEFNKKFTGEELIKLCASKDWKQHDQDVLNIICEGKTLFVDPSWDVVSTYGNAINYLPIHLYEEFKKSEENPKIVHYAGPRKPWKYNNALNNDDFWKFAYHTPFFKKLLFDIGNNNAYKNTILVMLFNRYPEKTYCKDDVYLNMHEYSLGQLSQSYSQIEILEITDNCLRVEGFSTSYGLEKNDIIQVYISINGSLYRTVNTGRNTTENRFEREYYRGHSFKLIIPTTELQEKNSIKIVLKLNNSHYIVNKNLRFGPFTGLNPELPKTYLDKGGFLLRIKEDNYYNQITITKSDKKRKKQYEKEFIKSLNNEKNLTRFEIYKITFIRYISDHYKNDKIWLLSDRDNIAKDNGEYLFRYLSSNKDKTIRAYFVVNENSKDYNRLKKYGKIIKAGSRKHKILFSIADKIVSSHCDPLCTNLLDRRYYSNCYKFDYVFLQHGIIKDDLSSTYSIYRNNMKMFVTSTKYEYQLIANNANYGCFENYTKLTGLPRFDYLTDHKEKYILIMPTWRRYCLKNVGTGQWELNSDFVDSPYYNNYQQLFKNDKLRNILKNYGYTLCYVPHELMKCTNEAFTYGEYVEIINTQLKSYSELFSKGSLLITDYSSTSFDFSYLKKPVIYWHFDKELFYSTHTYKETDFDYESQGFGKIVYDMDDLLKEIEYYLKNDCTMREEYVDRINSTFAYTDKNNCKRVINAIKTIKK